MSAKFLVNDVVPHKKTMSLLTDIIRHDENSLRASVVINDDTLFLNDNKVPAYIGIEYMAQTIAAFAGVQERMQGGEAKVGFLVGTRRYNSSVSHFDNHSTLIVDIEREFQADNGLGVFNCTIGCEQEEQKKESEKDEPSTLPTSKTLVSCVLNVFQPDDVEEFLSGSQ